MGMIVTVPKIGVGEDEPNKPFDEWLPTEGPFRPDTKSKWWQTIEERETEFVIEIMKSDIQDTIVDDGGSADAGPFPMEGGLE